MVILMVLPEMLVNKMVNYKNRYQTFLRKNAFSSNSFENIIEEPIVGRKDDINEGFDFPEGRDLLVRSQEIGGQYKKVIDRFGL